MNIHESKSVIDADDLVTQALKEDPGYTISDNFSSKLIGRIEAYKARRAYFREFLLYIFIVVALFGIATLVLFVSAGRPLADMPWFGDYRNIFIPCLILLVSVIFFDRVMLRMMYQLGQRKK